MDIFSLLYCLVINVRLALASYNLTVYFFSRIDSYYYFWILRFPRIVGDCRGIPLDFRIVSRSRSHLCTCGSTSWDVLLQASTQLRRSFRIFSRSSGQSRGCPILISKSRNCATWLFMSWICWNARKVKLAIGLHRLSHSAWRIHARFNVAIKLLPSLSPAIIIYFSRPAISRVHARPNIE